MKKSKTQLTWLNRALLSSPLEYALCISAKQYHRELKRLGVPRKYRGEFLPTECQAMAHRFESASGAVPFALVTIGHTGKLDGIKIASILMHEAVHIFQYIKEAIGEDEPGMETEAYSIQKIAQNLMYSYADQTGAKS